MCCGGVQKDGEMKQFDKVIRSLKIKIVIGFISLAISLSILGIEIYVWVKYAGMPTTEIPFWALWFMFRG